MYIRRAVVVLLVVAGSCSSGRTSTTGTTVATTTASGETTTVAGSVESTTTEPTNETGYFVVSGTSVWEFESGLRLSATIDGAELRPDESGNYTGTAEVRWGSGSNGDGGCDVTETVGSSSATMTAVQDGAGVLTLTIEYTTAGVHNVIVCGSVSNESTVSVTPDPLIIVGAVNGTLQNTQEHFITGEGEPMAGVADYQVVPIDDEGS